MITPNTAMSYEIKICSNRRVPLAEVFPGAVCSDARAWARRGFRLKPARPRTSPGKSRPVAKL
jgi:hypothetical protein